jgi:hypothetical protein
MASRREKGFYAAVNMTFSVDILPKNHENRVKGRGRLWAVDRLIQKRRSQDKKVRKYELSLLKIQY